MNTGDPITALLNGLRARDSAAEVQLMTDYPARLSGLAARKLGGQLQAKVTANDLAQDALGSFIRRFPASGWEVTDRQALWLLLARITYNKCFREKRKYLSGKRDARREVPLAGEDGAGVEPAARHDQPEDGVVFEDQLRWLLAQGDETDRKITALRLDGVEVHEISSLAGCSERKVYRWLEKLRGRLEAQE